MYNHFKNKETMRNTVRNTMLACLLAGAACCQAQPVHPLPPQPPVPGMCPNPPQPPGVPPGTRKLEALTSLSGKLTAYEANDHYEYDAFVLQTAEKNVSVKFPAHLAEQLMKAAAKGAQLTVNGTADWTPEGEVFHLYSVKVGDKVITDTPPAIAETPQADVLSDFKGVITGLNHDRRGMVNGVIIDSKLFVAFPPQAVEQLMGSLKTGKSISGSSVQHARPTGVVTAQNMQVSQARTVTIDDQTYLVR